MSFDTEKFITQVKNYPCIWNINDRCTNDEKIRAWNAVATEMFINWNLSSEEEREDKINRLKKKWRNVKDSFGKAYKQDNRDFGGRKKRKYIFYENLTFLIPVQEARRKSPQESTSTFASDESFKTDFQDGFSWDIPMPTRKKKRCVFEKDDVVNLEVKRERSQLKPREEAKDTTRQDSKETTLDDDYTNEDKSFFMSLLPSLKKLNDQQKMDFRIEVLSILRKIQFSDPLICEDACEIVYKVESLHSN